jgi:hypothetical protein
MIVLELDQVEVDYCLACGGVWLDAGELEILLEGAEDKDKLLSSLEVDEETKEKRIKCPICSNKMEKVLCGLEEKVRIDKCRDGDGLWFDKGELREIIGMGTFHSDKRVFDLINDIFGSEDDREKPPA